MGRHTIRLTIQIVDDIKVYLVSHHSGQQIAILTSTWWWQRLGKDTVSKQTTYSVHFERFSLKKLNEVEGKEQYHVENSNRLKALENSDTEVDVNKAWETITYLFTYSRS
jgi:hypothetical protein